jgi:hypothetical protein
MAFVRFCLNVPLMYPVAVVLPVSIGVVGCLYPNSSNIVLRTAPSFALMNTAPISFSAADEITCFRTLLTIKMAPFVSFCCFWWCFPCKRTPLPCFWLHFMKYKRHHCVSEISCQMHGNIFRFLMHVSVIEQFYDLVCGDFCGV